MCNISMIFLCSHSMLPSIVPSFGSGIFFFSLGKKLQHNPHKGWQGLKNVIFKEINTQAMKRNVRALNTNMRQYFLSF